jgi:hypothetical protein
MFSSMKKMEGDSANSPSIGFFAKEVTSSNLFIQERFWQVSAQQLQY